MLGELIYEAKGKRTSRRVISSSPQLVVEVSFEDMGKMLGIEGLNIGTYTSIPGPNGNLAGEGHGAFATMDGEMVMWKGIGAGKFGAGGSVSYRGALTYSTSSQKLAKLNSISGVFEFEVDAQGNTTSKIWEWK